MIEKKVKGVNDLMIRLAPVMLIIFTLILTSCNVSTDEDKTEIIVAAASSMTPALNEIAIDYEKDKNVQLTFVFGSSGKLAQQIRSGAPVDVFISASSSDMDKLDSEGLLKSETITVLTKNDLVVIQQKEASDDYPEDAYSMEINHFAIGNPDTVPAGIYAKEALIKLGKWDPLKPKLVYGKDVRQALTFVETGNADRGIVFRSDAQSSDKVEIIAEIDTKNHTEAAYPGAVIHSTSFPEEAQQFLDYMNSSQVQEILTDYGFSNQKGE